MRTTLSLTILSAVVLAMLPTSPASAAVWTKSDRNDRANWGGDIAFVRVANAPRKLHVDTSMHYDRNNRGLERIKVFVDTRRHNPGPEFRLTYVPASDRIVLHRVGRFRISGGTKRWCGGAEAFYGVSARAVHVEIPRWCMRIRGERPGAVRVAVRTSSPGGRIKDWMPRSRAFPAKWIAHTRQVSSH
jgi:hypothetical protein